MTARYGGKLESALKIFFNLIGRVSSGLIRFPACHDLEVPVKYAISRETEDKLYHAGRLVVEPEATRSSVISNSVTWTIAVKRHIHAHIRPTAGKLQPCSCS